MSEQWKLHACDVKLSNLSQVDEYKVIKFSYLCRSKKWKLRVEFPILSLVETMTTILLTQVVKKML